MQEGLRKPGDSEALKEILSRDGKLSIRRQFELLGLNMNTRYYEPVEESPEGLDLMLKWIRSVGPPLSKTVPIYFLELNIISFSRISVPDKYN